METHPDNDHHPGRMHPDWVPDTIDTVFQNQPSNKHQMMNKTHRKIVCVVVTVVGACMIMWLLYEIVKYTILIDHYDDIIAKKMDLAGAVYVEPSYKGISHAR